MWNYGMNVGLKAVSSNFYFSHDLHNEALSWHVQETQIWSLGQVVPLEKEMATNSIILAWKIPQRSLAGYSLWSLKELDTIAWIHFVKNKVPP